MDSSNLQSMENKVEFQIIFIIMQTILEKKFSKIKKTPKELDSQNQKK